MTTTKRLYIFENKNKH